MIQGTSLESELIKTESGLYMYMLKSRIYNCEVIIMLKSNVFDCALIIEGGGMRASYTSGFINTLLENQVYFDYVTGVSAGSSCTVNYLSRDIGRTEKSFVDLVLDKEFGGWGSFLKGEGFFRSDYIYEKTGLQDGTIPYNFNTFLENPAKFKIGALERDTGILKYFSREDIDSIGDLMKIVRASSSLPVFMPVTEFKGFHYYDGGLAGGITLDIAKKDGFIKFFVLLSRPRDYYKTPPKNGKLLKLLFKDHPNVYKAMVTRYEKYNQIKNELLELEKQGQAYLVFPENMQVSSREMNIEKLRQSYKDGYEQGRREYPKWEKFIKG